jgi:DHA2 family multidrug resistance protein
MNLSPAPSIPQAAVRTNVIVPLALAGVFVAGVGAQLLGPQTDALARGLHATGGGVSWLATFHACATFLAFSLSPLLARTFGLRRLFLASAALFAIAAGTAAMSTQLPALLIARTLQGFAGGMFGPLAFVAIFRTWGGPRLLLGFALLAFVLLVAANLAPLLSLPIVQAAGWRALFGLQVVLALPLLAAGLRWLPASLLNLDSTREEWVQVSLLGSASAAWVLVASQGARMGWLDSGALVGAAIAGVVLSGAFVAMHLRSKRRVLDAGKIVDRRFGIPIALNFLSRAASAATAFLLPHLATQSHPNGWWLLVAQVAAFPIAWGLMRRIDARVPMAAGLVLLAAGVLLTGYAVSMPVGLALTGMGQMLFLVPALMTGASALKPEHGPTGTIMFNMSSLGGATFGIAVIAQCIDAMSRPSDLQDAFLALSAVLLLAAPVTLLIGRSPSRR